MAASLSLTQLSSGNPVYDKYYRQVDPSGSGRVAATDAALFLKRSGLSDLVLGKIWDLADSECKGFLNKQQFFVALRLVACAQNGFEVAHKNLTVAVPSPKFHDTTSPLLPSNVPIDSPWMVKPEEKLKFDAIFDSLAPVGGILTGDKVKPVLLNSKLPVDVLGRVWELSDIDRDGMLDKDEFAVAMYLVYRALENEPVPMVLPPQLVPPSKRKKVNSPPVVPLLPSPPSLKERSSTHSGSQTLPAKLTPPQWVVSPGDKAKYDELFTKTDSDMDGLVSGPEVRDIFLKTGLPSATLARIWELCDIGDIGKLTREQFALALYLINQKLSKGIDPPQALSPEMIPPSDRLSRQNNALSCQAADFSAIKELDSLSNEIMDLQREKSSVEQEIKEKEESVRQRTNEVEDLQEEVQKESEELRKLQAERQEVQEALERLDEQKLSLEEQLKLLRQQCSQENQLIQSLQAEHSEQEQRIGDYEEELVRAREELLCLQEQTRTLGEKVSSARAQLCPLQDAVTESHTQIAQMQERLTELKTEEREVAAQLTWKVLVEEPPLVNGAAPPAEQPKLLQWPQPTEQPAKKPEDEYEDEEEEAEELTPQDEPHELRVTEEQLEEESAELSFSPKELKVDTVEDPFTSMMSTARTLSAAWPQNDPEGSSPAAEWELKGVEMKQQASNSTTKVESPAPEQKEDPPQPTSAPSESSASVPAVDFFPSDPFIDSDPFKSDDPFSKDISDPFGSDPFKGTDPFATDSFFKQSSSTTFSSEDPFVSSDPFSSNTGSAEPNLFSSHLNNAVAADPFSSSSGSTPFASKVDDPDESDPFSAAAGAGNDPFGGSELSSKETPAVANDPFAPGGTVVKADSDPDPFATVFGTGTESFVGGFADFRNLETSNGADHFASSSTHDKNLFKEENQLDVPPALPPKTGTPTRPPPPPPGKRSNIYRSDSSDSVQRRGMGEFSSLPAKDTVPDPFAPSAPSQVLREPDRFATFDKYPTEEDMIEWAKRESEREERERVARLTQQEQEDLELAIALSKSEFS
ncbi:epidermal growth factor receptor substrate 15 isoform X3 [Ictalurus furcatus]|uniref:epidermal growth factor receptor substrate 15 isoform X3 n=1 Tax=Ictalurus furcatus TaxID=66913 RepID=UPI0023507F58|nr:epidermal growth factor receptor substrate 15 isoform X3 [Ictalurus furcatus]